MGKRMTVMTTTVGRRMPRSATPARPKS
ncbi:MAG: hypothetical protein QOK01_2851, partial [Alphaproteobacteria bacterium]|nr:hypothetical protein [Alphaproteobacteria bacterium]